MTQWLGVSREAKPPRCWQLLPNEISEQGPILLLQLFSNYILCERRKPCVRHQVRAVVEIESLRRSDEYPCQFPPVAYGRSDLTNLLHIYFRAVFYFHQ